MTDAATPDDRRTRTRRRIVAVLGGAGLAVTLLAIAFVFATSASASRVAANAQALHWANATSGSAAIARAATAQALVFGIDHELGVASADARDTAIGEAATNLNAVETWARNADSLTDGDLRDQVAPALALLDQFIDAGRQTIDHIASGEVGEANITYSTVVEDTYAASTTDLLAIQESISARIDTTERIAGVMGMVTQILATLLIPAAAIVAYFIFARRQYREAHLRMESKIGAERELSRSKDEFIAGVSHELRTPLTGIYGFSEYLIEQEIIDPEEALELIGHINNEASELSRMVEDLLSAARLDSDAMTFEATVVDVTAAVSDVVTPLDRAGFAVSIEGSADAVYADPIRTRQIVRNLVSNAIKHGGDEIKVVLDQSGEHAVITVADNGDGVPQSVRARLFDRFVHEGRDSLLTGSVGLGLSIARSLTQRMGGDVSYVRSYGWTNFVVTLPLAEGLVIAGDDEEELPPILQISPNPNHDETALRVASIHATSSYIGVDDPFTDTTPPDYVIRFD